MKGVYGEFRHKAPRRDRALCQRGSLPNLRGADGAVLKRKQAMPPLKNGRRLHKIRKNGVGGLYFAVGILYTKTNTVLTPIRKVRLYDYH